MEKIHVLETPIRKAQNHKVNAEPEPSTSGIRSGQSAMATGNETELSARNILTAKRSNGISATDRQEIDELVRKAETLCISSVTEGQVSARTESELISQLQNAVAAILHVAKDSKGINGTYRRALKVAASSIMDAGAALVTRTLAEDAALETEINDYQGELTAFGNSLQQSKTPPASSVHLVAPVAPTKDTLNEEIIADAKVNIDISIFESSEWVDLRIWRMVGITKDQVVAAVAKKGGCPPELVICSDIIPYGKSGQEMDSVFVTLPEAVAEKVAEGLELLIGFISVLVKILPPKPIRCSMCMEAGHSRSECHSVVDCSDQCFRCGAQGHKANDCNLPPLCVLCEEVGKPSKHSVGDRACTAPSEIKWNR